MRLKMKQNTVKKTDCIFGVKQLTILTRLEVDELVYYVTRPRQKEYTATRTKDQF